MTRAPQPAGWAVAGIQRIGDASALNWICPQRGCTKYIWSCTHVKAKRLFDSRLPLLVHTQWNRPLTHDERWLVDLTEAVEA